ncbi:Phytanoyl-CoA dioxygenase [Reticulomyxa filosa]|uniref:Phytanoyl-CoA dioxygenase n=1 Tax=Reticulomyxa filosa TaxID=46433 RepID=X6PFK2_RETFI|nr:Phytanoyl-CoA dioxygenase [Reticulomyxa filosa]|eukprot:ETO36834.1 Phytanoyl-CoA dioxygenase [Reticulomyxa filosa]
MGSFLVEFFELKVMTSITKEKQIEETKESEKSDQTKKILLSPDKDSVQVGRLRLQWNKQLELMPNDNNSLKDMPLLREIANKSTQAEANKKTKMHFERGCYVYYMHAKIELSKTGYIYLQNYIPKDLIVKARNSIAKALHNTFGIIQTSAEHKIDDLYIKQDCNGVLLTGFKPITHAPEVLSVVHCKELVSLFRGLLDCHDIVTYDSKWLRIKGTNEYTEEHCDYYRFINGWNQLYTCWIPLMDIPFNRGGLAVCDQSHLLADFDEATDTVNEELPPSFTEYCKKSTTVWKTSNYAEGDVLIFDIRLIHASLVNTCDRFRVSIDTRWQPLKYASFEQNIRF